MIKWGIDSVRSGQVARMEGIGNGGLGRSSRALTGLSSAFWVLGFTDLHEPAYTAAEAVRMRIALVHNVTRFAWANSTMHGKATLGTIPFPLSRKHFLSQTYGFASGGRRSRCWSARGPTVRRRRRRWVSTARLTYLAATADTSPFNFAALDLVVAVILIAFSASSLSLAEKELIEL